MPQKAMKATVASSTAPESLNLPEKSRPAKTKTFLIHSCGRPVLIAARSGERRGTTGVAAEASAGIVGCSEVIVSIHSRGRVALQTLDEGLCALWRPESFTSDLRCFAVDERAQAQALGLGI